MTTEQRKRDEHIRRIVDAAPPLTPVRAEKLRMLLTPSPEVAAKMWLSAPRSPAASKLADAADQLPRWRFPMSCD
jgi:hypothetical protein